MEMKECRYCKNKGPQTLPVIGIVQSQYQVSCECGASGPMAKTTDTALAQWNAVQETIHRGELIEMKLDVPTYDGWGTWGE